MDFQLDTLQNLYNNEKLNECKHYILSNIQPLQKYKFKINNIVLGTMDLRRAYINRMPNEIGRWYSEYIKRLRRVN